MKKSILLVESHDKHADTIQAYFRKNDMTVRHVASLAEARAALKKEIFTTVIIDLNSDDGDILPFFQWMNDHPPAAGISSMVLAGKRQAPLAREIETLFHTPAIMKPFRLQDLMDHIRQNEYPGLLPTDREEHILSRMSGRTLGSAVIRKEIGRGGMGVVFLGEQTSLRRRVAVKILLPSLIGDISASERFSREARSIASLKSPHIVQIFDFDRMEEDLFYIVMEYLPGPTLERLLRSTGRFPVEHSVSLILQIARGLKEAHHRRLIHRDIKPSNVILDDQGRVTITDFGLVRPVSSPSSTRTGMIIGTPGYMAPEQISRLEVDERTDIYSLGVVFYQMLTGQLPFTSPNPMEILINHTKTPLPDPRLIVPDIPLAVVQILARMTDKQPAKRFPDCHHLISELENLNLKLPDDNWTLEPGPVTISTEMIEDSDTRQKPPQTSTHAEQMVPPAMIEAIQREVARAIGPIAPVVMAEVTEQMGHALPRLPMRAVDRLIDELLERVESDKRKNLKAALQKTVFDFRRKPS